MKQFFVLLLIVQLSKSKFFEAADKKIVNLYYVRACKENNENIFQLNISSAKHNRTHIGVNTRMNITVPELFDHTYGFEFEMRLWSDGGWKKNFVHIKRNNACNTLYMLLGPLWIAIMDAGHCKQGCPTQPGYYYFNNVYFDASSNQLILQPGRFFIIAKLLKNNIVPACLEIELEIKNAV